MKRNKKLLFSITTLLVLVIGLEGMAYALTRWQSQPKPTIKPRSDWGAVAPKTMTKRTTGTKVIFHHTGWQFSSTTTTNVVAEIKEVQDYHMNTKGWADIAYHYVIDPAGRIWQGRSDYYEGAHTSGQNMNVGVVVLGDFEGIWGIGANSLTTNAYNAMCSLSKYLAYRDSLDLPVAYNHKDFNPDTECPGDNMEYYVWDDLRGHLSTYLKKAN